MEVQVSSHVWTVQIRGGRRKVDVWEQMKRNGLAHLHMCREFPDQLVTAS